MAQKKVQVLAHSEIDPLHVPVGHSDWPGWRFVLRFTASGTFADFRMVYDGGREPPPRPTGITGPGDPRWVSWDPMTDDGPPITARLLRQVPLGALEAAARAYILDEARNFSQWARRRFRDKTLANQSDAIVARLESTMAARPGRRGRSDRDYALLAAMYVDALDGPEPVKAVAEAVNLSPTTVRNAIYQARLRGLLEDAPVRGKAGGRLTASAEAILNDETED